MRTMHSAHGPARLIRDLITSITLVAFTLLSLGCSSWQVRPITEVEVSDYKLVKEEVRFHMEDGTEVKMHVTEVDYPFVRGTPSGTKPVSTSDVGGGVGVAYSDDKSIIEVDSRDVAKMEIRKGNNAGVVVLVLVAITVIIVLIATAGSSEPAPTSSQSSCPVLYVQDGDEEHLVGEPYAGAAAGSIQRRDLMPLPVLADGRSRLVMVNEARETQYTDFAELVVADHRPGTRAVATNDQEVVLVGDAQPPVRAVDMAGNEVTAAVAAVDGDLWQSDLSQYVDDKNAPLTEELVVTFPRPASGDQPVLELELANTYWLDMVMNRFFALLGDKFDKGMQRVNEKSSGPRIKQWMEREGVDLKVEWESPDGWEDAGSVSSVGPVALRHVAVPLPPEAMESASPEITLRVSGGNGFWTIDQAGLSTLDKDQVAPRHIPPEVVQDDQGIDQRDQVAATDGNYQVLANAGDKVYLEFDLPPTEAGLVRSAFFHSDGYYVAHKPIQSNQSLSTLKTILDEDGALARFSLDLYRKYHEIALKTPRHEGSLSGSS